MSRPGKLSLIRTVALAAAAAAVAVGVSAGVAASAHSTPATQHALAEGGVISAD